MNLKCCGKHGCLGTNNPQFSVMVGILEHFFCNWKFSIRFRNFLSKVDVCYWKSELVCLLVHELMRWRISAAHSSGNRILSNRSCKYHAANNLYNNSGPPCLLVSLLAFLFDSDDQFPKCEFASIGIFIQIYIYSNIFI